MAEENTRNRAQANNEVSTPSTFASKYESTRLPLTSALQRPTVYATGDLFRLNGSSTEEVEDKDGNVAPRAVYNVQALNSQHLALGTNLTFKIKGQKSVLSEEDNLALLEGKTIPVVAFDNIRLWQVGANEGLTADGMRVLSISPAQAISNRPQGLIFKEG
ncbi:hypothetical protein [Companilactobacillus nuruki]|uniref:Uncharacterized protein n=1 Tax=Companilactobacillus nuruki TaxID=1993540 RepID=A0A2N7AWB5_9LACO|nr:hypothetical protein [Companilactobacillus nuruki]PMD73047.1 hypothetical protein CBP76_02630 [Companilactobacillus nuruki]